MVYCYFFGVWILPLLQTKLILWIPIDILFIFLLYRVIQTGFIEMLSLTISVGWRCTIPLLSG